MTVNGTRADLACKRIADDILSGVFRPGDRLEEIHLASRYGLSRTPVREALRQLASTGLVDIRPRRGARVSLPDRQTLTDLFEVLGEFEASCARFASVRMSAAERQRLSLSHDGAIEAARRNNVDLYIAFNREFHKLIYFGAHNASLLAAVLNMRERLAPFSRAQFRLPGRLMQSHSEHGQVVKAILAGDPAKAADTMRVHVTDIRAASSDYIHALDAGPAIRSLDLARS